MNETAPADESSALPQLALVAVSGLVAALGLVGNAALLASLCTTQSARLRNNLLLHRCASDLLVCAVSVPLATSARWGWSLGQTACKLIGFFMGIPVSLSTLSLTMLALDHYIALTCPRHRRHDAAMLSAVWVLTLLACALELLLQCADPEISPVLRTGLALTRLAVVHVVPCVAVAVCHVAVGFKLVETSLSAAAARGEVPLPVPLLYRPRHVIIVAGVANDGQSKVLPYRRGDDSSEDDALTFRIQADLMDLAARSKKHGKSIKKPGHAARELHHSLPPPLLVKPGQSLHSRRRLAHMLLLQMLVFTALWLPLITCELVVMLAASRIANSLRPLFLLLGYSHSAIAPLVYWLLNRGMLHGCTWICPDSSHSLPAKLRLFRMPPPEHCNPSSTNEAALGAFHPRFTVPKAGPPPRCATSQFLH